MGFRISQETTALGAFRPIRHLGQLPGVERAERTPFGEAERARAGALTPSTLRARLTPLFEGLAISEEGLTLLRRVDEALGAALGRLENLRAIVSGSGDLQGQDPAGARALAERVGENLEALSALAQETRSGGRRLLEGGGDILLFRRGPQSDSALLVTLPSLRPADLGRSAEATHPGSLADLDLSSEESRGASLAVVDRALGQVRGVREELRSLQRVALERSAAGLDRALGEISRAFRAGRVRGDIQELLGRSRFLIVREANLALETQSNAPTARVLDLLTPRQRVEAGTPASL